MNLINIKNTLSMDFNADEIRVVEGKFTKKGIIVSKSLSIPLPDGLYIDGEIQDMNQLVYILKKELSDNKISQGNVYGVVNSTNIIMREIAIPKVDDNQVEAILSYQLAEYLPVNPEEYVVKHMPIGTISVDGIEKLNILLIGIPKDIVESHLNLFKNINLKPQVLDFAGNSINKLVYFNDCINGQYIEKAIACIDLENDSVGLTITQEGIIKVSRVIKVEIDAINPDSQDYKLVSGLKTNINELLYNIDMVFRYFKTREVGNDIDLILLHGGMSDIEGIEQLFTKYFDKPCIRLNDLSKVKFGGDLAKYANAIGALIRIGEVKK